MLSQHFDVPCCLMFPPKPQVGQGQRFVFLKVKGLAVFEIRDSNAVMCQSDTLRLPEERLFFTPGPARWVHTKVHH